MARNRLGPKKVARLAKKTGLPVVTALTRGGTDHRIDLMIEGGAVVHLHRDGTLEPSDMRHNYCMWGAEVVDTTPKPRSAGNSTEASTDGKLQGR